MKSPIFFIKIGPTVLPRIFSSKEEAIDFAREWAPAGRYTIYQGVRLRVARKKPTARHPKGKLP